MSEKWAEKTGTTERITGLILNLSHEKSLNANKKSLEFGANANRKAKDGELKEAVRLYTLAIGLNASDFRFFCNRSFCHENLQEFKSALEDADQAIRLHPFRPKAHFMRGRALVGLKRWEEAEQVFKLAERLDPDSDDCYQELVKVRFLALQEIGFNASISLIAAQRHDSIEQAIDSLLLQEDHPTGDAKREHPPQLQRKSNRDKLAARPSAAAPRLRSKSRTGRQPFIASKIEFKIHKTATRLKYESEAASANQRLYAEEAKEKYNTMKQSVVNDGDPMPTLCRRRPPINIFGYKAIWIGNVGPRSKPEKLKEVFSRFGFIVMANVVPNSFCAFVCYDNPRSPSVAILHLYDRVIEGISNGSRVLKFRFAPGTDQDKNYHKTAARRNCDECYFWRTTGCSMGDLCPRLHRPICKGIDFQPFMKPAKCAQDL